MLICLILANYKGGINVITFIQTLPTIKNINMDDKEFISEGHYRDNNGNEYMSIWTYKRKNGLSGDSSQNYQDAKDISCGDKFWGPFNASNRFKEGYMYNVECLNDFYNN